MADQNHHFVQYAPEPLPYADDRYVRETSRWYGPLNAHQLDGCEHLCRNYSIADMAAYPWVVPYERQRHDTSQCPFLATWLEQIQTFSGDPAGLRNCQTNDTALTVDRNAKTAV